MVELKNSGTKSCETLLASYRQKVNKPIAVEKIRFDGVAGKDVYNISAPFEDEGELVIAGRVEERNSEQSETYFFVKRDGIWLPRSGSPVLQLQDPFYTRINDELIFGGVETFPHPQDSRRLAWRTVFYKGANVNELRPFFVGPDHMKDLRLVQTKNGDIGVFTRPQGEKGGRGKIGFTKVRSLNELTIDVVMEAPILEGQFLDDEWGGCNEIHLLSNGLLGILGHIARFDGAGNRHYYPMIFIYDPEKGVFSDMEIIAERADFLSGPYKRPDLANVVFGGGLVRHPDGTADLYAGTSDAEAQKMTIEDPFLKFER